MVQRSNHSFILCLYSQLLLSMNVISKQCRTFIPINDGLEFFKISDFYTFKDKLFPSTVTTVNKIF